MRDTTAGIIDKYNMIKAERAKCPTKTNKAWLDTFLQLEWVTCDEEESLEKD